MLFIVSQEPRASEHLDKEPPVHRFHLSLFPQRDLHALPHLLLAPEVFVKKLTGHTTLLNAHIIFFGNKLECFPHAMLGHLLLGLLEPFEPLSKCVENIPQLLIIINIYFSQVLQDFLASLREVHQNQNNPPKLPLKYSIL